MNTPADYYNLVTARHTKINPKQIYKTLKTGEYLIFREFIYLKNLFQIKNRREQEV